MTRIEPPALAAWQTG